MRGRTANTIVCVILNRLFSFYFTDLVGSAGKDERPDIMAAACTKESSPLSYEK